MASLVNQTSTAATERPQSSPLETAKQIAATMCHQPKEAYWLGARMDNFHRAFQRKMESVTAADVCNYLEGLMRKGQVEWQNKQSLDAIGLLMRYGYQREDLMIPALREAWGLRLNQRVGIFIPPVNTTAADGVATVSERLRRVLRVAHYALKTEKAYTQWWERLEAFADGRSSQVGSAVRTDCLSAAGN